MAFAISRRARRRATLTTFALLPTLLAGGLTLRPAFAREARVQDEPYTLSRTYKAGDVDHYKIAFHMVVNSPETGGNPMELLLSMLMKETTKEVKSDGNGVLVDQFEQASAKFGDNEMDASAFLPVITQTRTKTGKTLDTKSEGGNEQFAKGASQVLLIFSQQEGLYPATPVKVGDTWKVELTSAVSKDAKATGTATLVGKDKVGATDVLKIKLVTDTSAPVETPANGKQNVKLHFEGVGSMDPTNGKVLRMNATIDSETMQGKQKADVTLSLVPPGVDTKTDDKKTDAAKPAAPSADPKPGN